MGQYINYIGKQSLGTTFYEKCAVLKANGAVKITDEQYVPDMVCVVDNGFFGAAAYCYSEQEWKEFKHDCGRRKQWFVLKDASKHID